MTNIQTQFNFISVLSDQQTARMPPLGTNSEAVDLLNSLADFFSSLPQVAQRYSEPDTRCRTVSPPIRQDCCHPSGSLKVDSETGVITTPGGYKIEQIGQYEWKITGEDGKWTRVWGDPHVQESDRQNESTAWDFKRDSTFLLPDGTRINVSTKPYNNMTVTSQLEVINGNDRVLVTDIDKGKGKVGAVTQDGLQQVSDPCRDVFVMGRETDDWCFQGREIIGSNDGGESFKLGGQSGNDDMRQFLSQATIFGFRLMTALFRSFPVGRGVEADQGRERIREQIAAINQMFRTISELRNLDHQIALGRFSYQA